MSAGLSPAMQVLATVWQTAFALAGALAALVLLAVLVGGFLVLRAGCCGALRVRP